MAFRDDNKCGTKGTCEAIADSARHLIVMCRHGESEWNKLNLFCGWYDSDLSDKGRMEAKRAGKALREEGIKFDVAYASQLLRAQLTLNAILEEIDQTDIPIHYSWRLNERHYGDLTGRNKVEAVEEYGEEQVAIWRRSYDTPPPVMTEENEYYDSIVNDPRYAEEIPKDEFPMTESLKLCIERLMPFLERNDNTRNEGKTVLIAAHGNTLRGVVKHLDRMTSEQIMLLNLPTGIPFSYTLDGLYKPVDKMQFFGDEETVQKAIAEVTNQTKK